MNGYEIKFALISMFDGIEGRLIAALLCVFLFVISRFEPDVREPAVLGVGSLIAGLGVVTVGIINGIIIRDPEYPIAFASIMIGAGAGLACMGFGILKEIIKRRRHDRMFIARQSAPRRQVHHNNDGADGDRQVVVHGDRAHR